MTFVDWVIVALVALLAFRGYSRGFVVGALSLVGFVVGAMIGSRLAPLLLSGGSDSPYAALVALGGAVLCGGLLSRLLELVGLQARRLMLIPGMKAFDGIAGAILTGCVGLAFAWILGAALLQSASNLQLSASLRHDLQSSSILRFLNTELPPSGPILEALARVDPLPSIAGPPADVPAPYPGIIRTPGVRAAARSVVRVTGQACGLGIEGSGWVGSPGLIVTNAHVVAGEHDTVVQLGGVGESIPATVVVYDPHNDIAILRVSGLNVPTLPLAGQPAAGVAAAILGYPEDGPFTSRPGRLGSTRVTATQNAYGQPTLRPIASLRGVVRPGNSGGPMVDDRGEVVATVFAEVTNAPRNRPGGFAVPNAIVVRELAKAQSRHRAVSTAGCAA